MTKRIRELAVEAGLLIKKSNGDEFRYGNFDPRFQKFAELIVEECADVCESFGESGDGYTCSAEILEHFGVE